MVTFKENFTDFTEHAVLPHNMEIVSRSQIIVTSLHRPDNTGWRIEPEVLFDHCQSKICYIHVVQKIVQ